MTVHDDDIGGLFKAIGGQHNQFKEFSNQSGAAHAQERWPLFKTVSVEKRPPPPQLLQSEKQLWQEQSAPMPVPTAPAGKSRGQNLGDRIARGLTRLNQPHPNVPQHPSLSAPLHGATSAAGIAQAPARQSARLTPLPSVSSDAVPAARRVSGSSRAQAADALPPGPGLGLFGASRAGGETAALNTGRSAAAAGQRQFGTGAFSRAIAGAATSLAPRAAAHQDAAPGQTGRLTPPSASGSPPRIRAGMFSRHEEPPPPPPLAKGVARSKTRVSLFATQAPAMAPAAPPRRLFDKAMPVPEKNLFATAPGTGHAGDSQGKLSSLFERIAEGNTPAGGKPRGLFNRNG